MRAITKHSPAATAAAPRRWFHTVQWVRKLETVWPTRLAALARRR